MKYNVSDGLFYVPVHSFIARHSGDKSFHHLSADSKNLVFEKWPFEKNARTEHRLYRRTNTETTCNITVRKKLNVPAYQHDTWWTYTYHSFTSNSNEIDVNVAAQATHGITWKVKNLIHWHKQHLDLVLYRTFNWNLHPPGVLWHMIPRIIFIYWTALWDS